MRRTVRLPEQVMLTLRNRLAISWSINNCNCIISSTHFSLDKSSTPLQILFSIQTSFNKMEHDKDFLHLLLYFLLHNSLEMKKCPWWWRILALLKLTGVSSFAVDKVPHKICAGNPFYWRKLFAWLLVWRIPVWEVSRVKGTSSHVYIGSRRAWWTSLEHLWEERRRR